MKRPINEVFNCLNTTRKVSAFGVFLVRIFPHPDWIRRDGSISPYSARMKKIQTWRTPNTDTFHVVSSVQLSFKNPSALFPNVQVSFKCLSVISVQVSKLLLVPNFSMFVSSLSALIKTRINDKTLSYLNLMSLMSWTSGTYIFGSLIVKILSSSLALTLLTSAAKHTVLSI